MAKFFGQKSKYLKSKMFNISLVALSISIILVICGLFLIYFSYRFNSPWTLIVAILFFALTLSFKLKSKTWLVLFDKFANGLDGENAIAETLKTLPDDYSIFYDVQINPDRGNTDFVVIGPTGLFTIEVKSHKGNITYDGSTLIRNGRSLEKDFLHQSMNEALSLNHYLHEKLNTEIFVKPILVFSSHARMKFGFKKVESVFVVHKDWLARLITEEQSLCNFLVDRQLIEEEIRALVKEEKQD